jgi:hypothetical protein
LERYRTAVLVPDQNGCADREVREGGNLGIPPGQLWGRDTYKLRLGVAKTKGKYRVVTMQKGAVKRVLDPVHSCLYDHISASKWIVRGEVSREHVFHVLRSIRPGESVISGDYEAATDNIYLESVQTIIDTLAESPHLSPLERTLLKGSFDPKNLAWTSRNGHKYPIRRGSMMGNKVSFVVLCLLNKVCYDICADLRRKRSGEARWDNALINGDDIAFAGDSSFYDDWVSVTSHFGFRVNQKKTGVSDVYLELNSRTFRFRRLRGENRWAVKPLRKPVLSGLLPGLEPGCVLSRLIQGLSTLSPGALRWAIIQMRHSIRLAGVTLSSVPSRIVRNLLREKWFRLSLLAPRGELVVEGVTRAWPVILSSFRPPESHLRLYEFQKREIMRLGVRMAEGVCLPPPSSRIRPIKEEVAPHFSKLRIGVRASWAWTWIAPLYEWWKANSPLLPLSTGTWEDDHPDLTVKVEHFILPSSYPPPLDPEVRVLDPNLSALGPGQVRSLQAAIRSSTL